MASTVNKREDFRLESYEGLVRSTAHRYERQAAAKGIEFDDFAQVLRIRVWRALDAYDTDRSTMTVRRFVFQCVVNQVKDVLKARTKGEAMRSHHPGEVHIDDLVPATNDGVPNIDSSGNALRFLSVDDEHEHALLDDPELPESLSDDERRVAMMLIEGYTQPVIAQELGCNLAMVRSHIAAMRLKLGGATLPPGELSAA